MSLLSRLAVQAARAYGMLAAGSANNVSADYLVVAGGGGGGGSTAGGGGGAGGYRTSTATLSSLNTYSVTVGAGGNGGANSSSGIGSNGSDSILSGTGLTTITSTGGGGGGNGNNNSGNSGGSGGGGGGKDPFASGTNAGGSGNTPSTSPSQGNNGGNGAVAYWYSGGGGGGASAVGGVGTGGASGAGSGSSVAGNGGNGTSSSISGSSVTYAGGGGGGAFGTAGTGGSGGGGNGTTGTNGANGSTNTGGGGGGAGGSGGTGGTGGSGIVIISYTSATPKFVGGTITTSGGKQIHTFTSSGTLSPITPITASYLVVAGGGGGGTGSSGGQGGGGAGGLLTNSTTLYSGATYVVTVGGGGAQGVNGSNSVVSGTGLTTLTATGGGYGGSASFQAGASGGSGGGGSEGNNPSDGGNGGAGTSGQGSNGGKGAGGAGGGGGGASAVGAAAAGSGGAGVVPGNGGAGTSSSISGTSVTYAGGGGGSGFGPYTPSSTGTGGAGGGGTGASGQNGSVATPGTPNTGGGGGAKNTSGSGSASGGSGIVIISYAGSQQFNGGLVTSSGGNTIHTFTSTGALTPLTNNLTNSLRFRSSASAYLSRTASVTGNQKTWTFSSWVKRGALSGGTQYGRIMSTQGSFGVGINFMNDDTLRMYFGGSAVLQTTQVFRDPSAWYHIVLALDTTQATAANRVKLYVNGQQVTAFSTATYPNQNDTFGWNNGSIVHQIAASTGDGATAYFDGYQTDINSVDGQALEPYYFGNNDANGVWKPILYKGTYGTNGFYLTFGNTTSTTTLGYDSSPNGNNWTCNNISLTAGTTYDAMTDVPTNTSATVANYAVINPLDFISANGTISSANLNWASSASGCGNRATIGSNSGKWYWEAIGSSVTSGTVGGRFAFTGSDTIAVEQDKFGMYWHPTSGIARIVNGTNTYVTSAYTYTNSDVLALALDLDNNISYWYKNGVLQYTYDFSAYSTIGARVFFPYVWNASSGTPSWVYNFGQRAFSYTPPTGYVALNTFNLPTPTILQGNKYMDATLYTGNGVSNTIVNQGQFKPDLVWVKSRSSVQGHGLYNPLMSGYILDTSSTAAQQATAAITNNANGWTMPDAVYNNNAVSYVGWQWQAGQGTTSSNTSGSITSTVSVSTTAGFSIVTYTGTGANATVGHGLGVAPKMVIIKNRTAAATAWNVYQASIPSGNLLSLNSTAASFANTNRITAVSSTTFSIGADSDVNGSTNSHVAYCWAEIAGFSRFGSYTGANNTGASTPNANGPFVYLGFRPKFVLIKRTSSAAQWVIYDSSRGTFNANYPWLYPNATDAETATEAIDFLSNGFKIRSESGATMFPDGATFIYAAFAENPFKNSNAR